MLLISMTQEIRVVMQGNTHSQGGGMSVRRPGFVLGAISILLTSAITSCSAPVDSVLNGLGDGNGDRTNFRGVPHEDTDQGQSGQNSEGNIKVAPGTLPPTGEPQPGHARLNADGYYDYTADDFVLGDPCPPEIRANFADDGYEVDPHKSEISDQPDDPRFCIVDMNNRGPGTGISIEAKSSSDHRRDGALVEIVTHQKKTAYTLTLGTGDTGFCKAGIDTPDGSRGIYQPWGEFSQYNTPSDACEIAAMRLFQYNIGETKNAH